MPTSLLEAMSFGLPSLTAPVGGTADFFEDGKMGVLTKSRNPEELYSLLKPYFDNPEKLLKFLVTIMSMLVGDLKPLQWQIRWRKSCKSIFFANKQCNII